MKDFKQIDAKDVIPHLTAGKEIYACVLKSSNFRERLIDLKDMTVEYIVKLLKEENTVFFERLED